MRRLIASAALLAPALLPAAAPAHSLVRPAGAVIAYIAADATSLNTLSVGLRAGRIEFRDPTVDGGMDPGDCTPGETTNDANLWIVQSFCPARGVTAVRVDLGEREDTAAVALPGPLSATVLGGPGADRLTAGDERDTLTGDDGDDTLAAGGGADTVAGGLGIDRIEAGDGDDVVQVRDGLADTVRCGEGDDTVDADLLDDLGADCERITRTPTPPPADAATGPDRIAPRLRVGAITVQRLGRSRTVRVAATSTERGSLAASGLLDVGGLSLALRSARKRLTVAGGGVEIAIRLSPRQWRECLRAFRKRRRVTARLSVVATDSAGNSRRANAPVIRLRR